MFVGTAWYVLVLLGSVGLFLVFLGLLRLLEYHGLVFAGCACFDLLGLLWFSGLGCIDLQNVLLIILCLRPTTVCVLFSNVFLLSAMAGFWMPQVHARVA